MKKVFYYLLSVCLFSFSTQVSAQVYTETLHRAYTITGETDLCKGGTYVISLWISNVTVTSRSQELLNRNFTKGSGTGDGTGFDYYTYTSETGDNLAGVLLKDYADITDEPFSVYAGQEFTISGATDGQGGWTNATLFVDWDGNGSFDDHDPHLYDLYGGQSTSFMEFNGQGNNGDRKIKPQWTIRVPETFTSEAKVRIRMRVDETLNETFVVRNRAIGAAGGSIYGATNGHCTSNAVPNAYQYFYSMLMHRYLPTGQFYKGTTVDMEMHVVPDTYSPMQVQSVTETVHNAVGGATCGTPQGMAISTADQLMAWLNNPTTDAYLTADITLNNRISGIEFFGALDGQGHTITFAAAGATITETQKDNSFFPLATGGGGMRDQLSSYDNVTQTPGITSTFPLYNIAGALFGKLGSDAVVKNLTVRYDAANTYTGNNNMIFGVIAGISRGRIENVKVDISQNITVQSSKSDRPWAIGGLTGILFHGVVKNCEVALNNRSFTLISTDATNSSKVKGETCMGGLIGRLQAGIVSNVKFSGAAAATMSMPALGSETYSCYYMGGIAGMTNTPKAIFCGHTVGGATDKYMYWGYDNGSTGLDVNNVIIDYQGSMNMNVAATGDNLYYCRGLVFGEATDTATVPVLVTRGGAFTIEQNAVGTASISGANIPFISKPKGSCNENQTSATHWVGKLYLYRDGRYPFNAGNSNKYTKVAAADCDLNWGYTTEEITKSDGTTTENSCVTYYKPYVVATYNGTDAAVQNIETTAPNVSLGGTIDAKPFTVIEPEPGSTTAVDWTWTTTPPPAADIDQPICGTGGGAGGGAGEPIAVRATNMVCTHGGNSGHNERYTTSVGITGNLGASFNSGNVLQTGKKQAIYQDERNDANLITVSKGETLTPTMNYVGSWMHKYVFIDYNNDGDFTDPGELVCYSYLGGVNSRGVAASDGGGAPLPSFDLPADLTPGTYTIRFKVDWNSGDPCGTANIASNGGVIADFVLGVKNALGVVPVGAGAAADAYVKPTTYKTSGTNQYTGYMSSINIRKNATSVFSRSYANNVSGYQEADPITINSGETLNLQAVGSPATNDGWKWTSVYAFADLNCDGDFTDAGERLYAGNSTGSDAGTDVYESIAQWTGNITFPLLAKQNLTFTGNGTSLIRIMTVGERNATTAASRDEEYRTGNYTNNGNGTNGSADNYFHCYDYPITVIGASPSCTYIHDFGTVYIGESATYTIKMDVVPDAAPVTVAAAGSPFTYTYNDVTNEIEVTYTPTAVGEVTESPLCTFTVGGDDYDVEVRGTGAATQHVRYQVAGEGGGQFSLDLGNTLAGFELDFVSYKREVVTAVPVGPTRITKWQISTDNGVTFTDIVGSEGVLDNQYNGATDAIIQAVFDFKDYEGDFGVTQFTDNGTHPFYIKRIQTTGGLIDVDADNIFTERTAGTARYTYLNTQGIQTRTIDLGAMTHQVTVDVANINNFGGDVRLMCFIDFNGNGYFDFAAPTGGLAKNLVVGNELIFVGEKGGTGYSQNGTTGTFTFTFTNANITENVIGRIRFIAATYVDAYGLGPLNQYNNYWPRIDSGSGNVDTSISLSDNNGSRFTPNNQCYLRNYVNAVDANFDVVLYLQANEQYVVGRGQGLKQRTGYVYIESVESEEQDIQSGVIMHDDAAGARGSISIGGNFVIKKRIYKDRWHHISFPFEVEGTAGATGIRVIEEATGYPTRIDDNAWILHEFNAPGRNSTGGFGSDNVPSGDRATLQKGKVYFFGADNIAANGQPCKTYTDAQGREYYWVLFQSVKKGWEIKHTKADKKVLEFAVDQDAAEYWNRNVYVFANPYLSPVKIQDVTSSVGWENITWWNAATERYAGVSAAENEDMPSYFGYWVQFTEDYPDDGTIEVTLGDNTKTHDQYSHSRFSARESSASSFDVPDSYTIGINRAEALNEKAVSKTIVTLTDAGSVNEMRAGYDQPISYAKRGTLPEIWSLAGSSRMMFNDVHRDDEVIVPLGIRIKEAGEYAIRLTHTNCQDALVQLYDRQTGARVELQREGNSSSYSFLAEAGDNERFDLIIGAPKMTTGIDVVDVIDNATDVLIYKTGDMLRVQHAPMGHRVDVCDVVGREIMNATVTDDDMQLRLPNTQGVYLVTVRNEQGAAVRIVKLTR